MVRGVMARSICAGSIVAVLGSTSTNTARAPVYSMAATVATNVNGTEMTSSPGPTPAASIAKWRALVPEFTGHAVLGSAIVGERLLERGNFTTKHELRALEYAQHRRVDFRLDAAILRFQI